MLIMRITPDQFKNRRPCYSVSDLSLLCFYELGSSFAVVFNVFLSNVERPCGNKPEDYATSKLIFLLVHVKLLFQSFCKGKGVRASFYYNNCKHVMKLHLSV